MATTEDETTISFGEPRIQNEAGRRRPQLRLRQSAVGLGFASVLFFGLPTFPSTGSQPGFQNAATHSSRAFVLRPGVVVDPGRPAVYLMGSEKRVKAVDPRSGRLIWESEETAKPLMVAGTFGRGAWTLQQNGTCGKPDYLVVRNQMISGTQVDEACTKITTGPAITSTGNWTLRAPMISMGNGTSIGGTFVAENVVP